MSFAPIALFVYNRLARVRRMVVALQKNDLAKDSDLIVFSDVPKSVAQADAVREVREYIRQIIGFKSVTLVEGDTNFGLARWQVNDQATGAGCFACSVLAQEPPVGLLHNSQTCPSAVSGLAHR